MAGLETKALPEAAQPLILLFLRPFYKKTEWPSAF